MRGHSASRWVKTGRSSYVVGRRSRRQRSRTIAETQSGSWQASVHKNLRPDRRRRSGSSHLLLGKLEVRPISPKTFNAKDATLHTGLRRVEFLPTLAVVVGDIGGLYNDPLERSEADLHSRSAAEARS
jgi:hypothetical protein